MSTDISRFIDLDLSRIRSDRFFDTLPFEKVGPEEHVVTDRYDARQNFYVLRNDALRMSAGPIAEQIAQVMKVPLLDADGKTDYMRQVDVEFINTARFAPMRGESVAYEDVVKRAVSTTVFIGAQKGEDGWSGSGVVVEPSDLPLDLGHYADGVQFVLTNHHVAGDADRMWIVLPNGTETWGEVAVTSDGHPIKDELDDFALVAINPPRRLPTARIGDSSDMERGDEVLVAGYPKGMGTMSITKGIITGPMAETSYLLPGLQTDAAINPGNSGGPMFDVKSGRIVGINTYVFTNSQNIGFAQPIDDLIADMALIGWTGRVIRGYTGVGLSQFPLRDRATVGFLKELGFEDDTGAVVTYVDPNSPTVLTGIEGGDIVTSIDYVINGVRVGSFDINYYNIYQIGLMDRIIAGMQPGATAVYHVYRPKAGGGFEPERLIAVDVDELTVEKFRELRSNL